MGRIHEMKSVLFGIVLTTSSSKHVSFKAKSCQSGNPISLRTIGFQD
jgi:hypothetical protein